MGNNTKNIIEINGKRYDAITGSVLGGASTKAVVRSVDGFTAAPKSSAIQPVISQANQKRGGHTPAAHLAPHKPQKAATLMRSAVKKPDLKAKRIVAQSPAQSLATITPSKISPKLSHTRIDPVRQKRASRTIQSPAVSKYGTVSAIDSITSTQASLAPYTAQPAKLTEKTAFPDIPARPIHHVTKQQDVFDRALGQSVGKKRRGRFGAVATASLAVLLVIGLFAYFNAPQLSLRMASSRAGFEARLPHYSPAGFSFGNLTYSPGNVTLSYKDGDDSSRQFAITQKASDWNSESLLSNFVTTAASAYQTYERAGRTVYVYGDNTATWVDSGIWYTINGSNGLTKHQILDLAGSL